MAPLFRVLVVAILTVGPLSGEGAEARRVLCSLTVKGGGWILRAENLSRSAVDVVILAQLIMSPEPPEPGDELRPEILARAVRPEYPILDVRRYYRAQLDLAENVVHAAAGTTRLRLGPGEAQEWLLKPASLSWYVKSGAVQSHDGSYRQTVPPGQYRLREVLGGGQFDGWASREMLVVAGKGGLMPVEQPLE